MLYLQELLRTDASGLDVVKNELGINVYIHPDKPLVGFKYCQIDSPKTHPVVRECRGIVLEADSWSLVAKSFNRFFNAGEVAEEFATFNWSDFYCNAKEDGSLILLYFYDKEWRVNTSGSFGLGEVQFSGTTWRELFWRTSGIDRRDLNEDFTYIFELCTPYNKVVRQYVEPKVFLLSMFLGETEMTPDFVDDAAKLIDVTRPLSYNFTSHDDILTFLTQKEDEDPTYEGVIIRDDKNLRFKLKTKTYVAYHHLHDNGNLMNPKRLVPLIMAGEMDEVCAIFPEAKDRITEIDEEVKGHWQSLLSLWRQYKDIENQKEFALAIKGKTPFTGILFNVRHKHGKDQTEELLRLEWRSEPDRIVKILYR